MLHSLLAYQFDRQATGAARAQAPALAQRLSALALQPGHGIDWLCQCISVAEFLAREVRHPIALQPAHLSPQP